MWTKVATLCSVPPMRDLFPPMAKATALISERGNGKEGGLGMTQQGKNTLVFLSYYICEKTRTRVKVTDQDRTRTDIVPI